MRVKAARMRERPAAAGWPPSSRYLRTVMVMSAAKMSFTVAPGNLDLPVVVAAAAAAARKAAAVLSFGQKAEGGC